jgi:hypothetical membrane protein
MLKSHQIALALSILVVVTYVSFTAAALAGYPGSFSPQNNWLSDLGDRITSPEGSKFYNAGIYGAGSLLALFFIALNAIRIKDRKPQNIVLTLAIAFGVFGALSMILTGVFSIDNPQVHSLFSAMNRIGTGTAFGLSVAALAYHKGVRRGILVIGVITTLTDLITSVFFNTIHLLEWPVIFLFLAYCLLLGIETNRLARSRQGTA